MAKLRSINPSNGKELGSVNIVTKIKVEETADRAQKAFKSWREVPLAKKEKTMLKLAELLKKNSKRLGELITKEMGKPLKEAVEEVAFDEELVKYFAKEGVDVLRDEVIDTKITKTELNKINKLKIQDAVDYLIKKNIKVCSVIRYDPVGVVASIKPWNFPVDSALLSVVPALMAGNCVILKPSENVPLVSNELAKLIWQAGVPKEVFQIIHGRAQVGSMLVDSNINMVSFTGSTEVGRDIAERCSKRFVKYSLEMGGSSPAIVCSDADLDLAVNGILWGRFNNCGQVCNAIKRVFVVSSVAQAFTDKLAKRMEELVVGDPMEKDINVGPLASEKQLKKLQDQVTRGVIQGGRIIVGGRRMREEEFANGYYHEPTLMININTKNPVMHEEVFGPVLPVCTVDTFEKAIKYANQSKYGLTASVFTKSKINAKKAIKELEAGSIYVNDVSVIPLEAPWCGVKDSGVGVGGGKHGIWEYVHKKHVHVNLDNIKTRDGWF
ncbi:MAG: aldehyde dehydrogenase family protein [Candidatus Beckwithbacteria bacterium]|nr:aldehyde dehydrogenase family protein [Patescibacteria group bacterium]